MNISIGRAFTRSSSRKKRAQKESTSAACCECPVCLEPTVDDNFRRNPVSAFSCSHFTCRDCDKQLFIRLDDKCPLCRAQRTEHSTTRHMMCATNSAVRSIATLERARQSSQGFSVFFPARSALQESTFQQALFITVDDDQRNSFTTHTAGTHGIRHGPSTILQFSDAVHVNM
jgi:hypothetical protein